MKEILLIILSLCLISCGHLVNQAPPKVEVTYSKDKDISCEEIRKEILDMQEKQISSQKQIDTQKIIQIEVPEILGKDWCNYFTAGMGKNDFDELIQKSRPP
jgi:hypothetical protein